MASILPSFPEEDDPLSTITICPQTVQRGFSLDFRVNTYCSEIKATRVECVICQENNSNDGLMINACKHQFHDSCLRIEVEKKCNHHKVDGLPSIYAHKFLMPFELISLTVFHSPGDGWIRLRAAQYAAMSSAFDRVSRKFFSFLEFEDFLRVWESYVFLTLFFAGGVGGGGSREPVRHSDRQWA